MANKRMFSMNIVDSDAFLDMPQSTQNLYFHLCMRADDDGFVGNPKKILRLIGGAVDDLRVLVTKKFVLDFENGVIVIKHWRMHNTLQTDRYKPTSYLDERKKLFIKEDKSYTFDKAKADVSKMFPKCFQSGNTDIDLDLVKDLDTQKYVSKKEKNNLEEYSARTCESYEEIMDDLEVSASLKAVLFEFIKHLKANKIVMINSRLESIIVRLDMLYREEKDKIEVVRQAISNGWKRLAFEG